MKTDQIEREAIKRDAIKRDVIEREAIGLVKSEKTAWETSLAFVTDKIAFNMREVIRTCRKNYWGVFDSEIDPTTGRKKIWVPLTESLVESVVKNIDLDTKDLQFKAKRPESTGLTGLVRSIVKVRLDRLGFGEKLDELERTLAIDGTAVWSTEDIDGISVQLVDLLNFYIDPTASSIADAGSVIERIVIPKPTFEKLARDNGWINADKVQGTKTISKTDADFTSTGLTGDTEYVELFRRRGWMPKSLLTGEQDQTSVPGEIVCSATKGSWMVHSITKRKDNKLKGYEECWYTRVPGRWYGKGISEKLLMLQGWMNTIVNIRINRSYVSQLGLFKIRQGSGITPQMISRLGANGAILVQSMQDIEQMVIQEASASSYKDEDTIMGWGRQVTAAFEAVTGETMPSSTTATIGAIQNRNALSQFVLIKEGIGMFLQRWIKNYALPIIMKSVTRNEVYRYFPDRLQEYDAMQVNNLMYQALEQANTQGLFVDPMQVELERQAALARLQQMGEQRFVDLQDNINWTDYDVEVQVTNEDVDKGVLMQNLLTALQAAPEYKQPILEQVFDLMGIGPFKAPPMPPMGMVPPTAPGEQNPQELMTQANTGEAFGKAQALTTMAYGNG